MPAARGRWSASSRTLRFGPPAAARRTRELGLLLSLYAASPPPP
jgi:hypothetical protein